MCVNSRRPTQRIRSIADFSEWYFFASRPSPKNARAINPVAQSYVKSLSRQVRSQLAKDRRHDVSDVQGSRFGVLPYALPALRLQAGLLAQAVERKDARLVENHFRLG